MLSLRSFIRSPLASGAAARVFLTPPRPLNLRLYGTRQGRRQRGGQWDENQENRGSHRGGQWKGGTNYGSLLEASTGQFTFKGLPKPDLLVPRVKGYYVEQPEVANRPVAELDEFLSKASMNISGQNLPKPALTFAEAGFNQGIVDQAAKMNFVRPTEIQSVGWTCALAGRDFIGVARTGSGKTLAFGLPTLLHIANQPKRQRGDGPIAVCLAPTRELACQIQKSIEPWAAAMGLRVGAVYGGKGMGEHISLVRHGVDFLIATPGRLLGLMEGNHVDLFRVTCLIMDEADRMLDMGFEPQIRKVMTQVRQDRQTLMWSATWPQSIRNLADEFLTEPMKVVVGGRSLACNPDVTQHFRLVDDEYEGKKILIDLLQGELSGKKVLVFRHTKWGTMSLARELNEAGIKAYELHGNLNQNRRDTALAKFRRNKSAIMVATDVASRGLDIDDIEAVVNMEFPQVFEDYVHRIGRTGRAGRKGDSYTFLSPSEEKHAQKLVRVVSASKQSPPEELLEFARNSGR